MPVFQARLKVLSFRQKEYTITLQKRMHRLNVEASGEWLRALLVRVPTATGMARASFLPLSRFLESHAINVPVPISPTKKPSRSRNIPLGEASAQYPLDCYSFTDAGEFLFSFDETLWHYLHNEFAEGGAGPYKNPSDPSIQPPWESFALGRAAYYNYVRQNYQRRVPRIGEFIVALKVLRVGV